jgi:hypothetical protein
MTWDSVYLILFGVGLAFSALSFLGVFSHFHAGHFHFGGHGHVAGTSHGIHGDTISPINGFTLTAFLCWFGGAGYLLHHYSVFVAPVVLTLSVLSGLAGAALVFWFLASVLLPREHQMSTEETNMVGVVARVSGAIRDGGTGEILFSQSGARRSAPARSDDGLPIVKDTEVVVMRYERGIAYVQRWDELTGELESSQRLET